MKFNFKSNGILLALVFSTKANVIGTISSQVYTSKSIPTLNNYSKTIPSYNNFSKSIPTTTVSSQSIPTISVSSKTIPKINNSSKTIPKSNDNSSPMVKTVLLYTMYGPLFTQTVMKIPSDVKTVLLDCKTDGAEHLPTSICDSKSTCYGKYATFTVTNSNTLYAKPNGKCDIYTHKANEPIPTTNYVVTDLCTPVVETYSRVTSSSVKSKATTKYDEAGFTTYITTYTIKNSYSHTESTKCQATSIPNTTVKMIARDIKTSTSKSIPAVETTTTDKIIPITTSNAKALSGTTSITVTYWASSINENTYGQYFSTTVINIPASVKKVQMECTYTRRKTYDATQELPSSLLTVSSSQSEEVIYDHVDDKYVDNCGGLYGLYKQVPFVREPGTCEIYTHKGEEIQSQSLPRLCSPEKTSYLTTFNTLIGKNIKTLDINYDTTILEAATTYKKTTETTTSTICGTVCSTKIQSIPTTISTKIPPPATITTTTTTTKSIIPTSKNTSSSSVTTSTSSTKNSIVYVTVVEKEIVTITEKETVTITVKDSPDPTSFNDDRQCADKWAQCGGLGFTGPTCCKEGYFCHELNPYYSQCI